MVNLTNVGNAPGITGNLIVPLVVWGPTPPTQRIKSLAILPTKLTIVTGTLDGHVCIWSRESQDKDDPFSPRHVLFLHPSPVVCLAPAGVDPSTSHFISSSRNGLTCLWNSEDGNCIESNQSSNVHMIIRPHAVRGPGGALSLRLFCAGHYPEILVLDPHSLQLHFTLSSRVEPDWISAFCILKPPQKHDIVIGLSTAGMVKIWSLNDIQSKDTQTPIFEDESKQIRAQSALSIDPCPFNQRTMMVVSLHSWQVFDASDFSMLVSCEPPSGEHWLGGCFIKLDKVMAWASNGRAYLYQLPRDAVLTSPQSTGPPFDRVLCYCVLKLKPEDELKTSNSEPIFHYVRGEIEEGSEKPEKDWLFRGDVEGRVLGWRVPQVPDKSIIALQQESFKSNPELIPQISCSLQEAWAALPEKPSGITSHMDEKEPGITTTVYVGSQGRLILGRSDGSILLLSATQALISQLLSTAPNNPHKIRPDWPQTRILMGHNEAVTCLLYPHEEHPRYDPAHLLSGGADFSICFWNLLTGSRLHRFCVQAGPIIRLIVPPPNCNPRILQAVCSVAEDHSVALLGLKEQKCILLASRHLFPVSDVYWRPLDDFILVKCEDSTVYVWQMETGHLDRIVSGVVAEEIVSACQEQVGVGGDGEEDVQGASVSVQMFRAIRHKNVSAMKKIAAGGNETSDVVDERHLSTGAPMIIQGLRTVHSDPESHVVLFNVEAMIMGLLAEENSLGISGSSSDASMSQEGNRDASPSLSGLLALAKDKAEKALRSPTPTRRTHGSSSSSGRSQRKESGAGVAVQLQFDRESSLCMEVARVLMSLLHGWNLDKDLDKVCLGKLGLLPPKAPVCFGLVSRQGFLSVMLPSGIENYKKAAKSQQAPAAPPIDSDVLWFTTKLHWQTSATLTTQHLLAVIATANTLMSMSSAGFLPEQEKKRKLVKRMSTHGAQKGGHGSGISQETADALTTEQGQIKQGWSLQAALHCVLLPELVHKETYKSPRIELLARRWQERCLELREAAQALLLRELNRLGPKGRKILIDSWSPYLPTQLDPSLSIFGAYHFGGHPSHPSSRTPGSGLPSPAAVSSSASGYPPPSQDGGDHGSKGGPPLAGGPGSFEPLLAASDSVVSGTSPPSDTSLQAVRKNQATAVVLLGVIGAEFGQEIAQHPRTPAPTLSAPVGFSEKDYSLARATSQSLLELLIQPPSALLPPFSPLRRAAIDLLGRGFVVWQPYLDISKVLLGLLELSANSDRLIPSPPVIFPLSPVSDGCRTARHALTLIATARPPAFITALSKEVARFNAATQHSTLQPGSSPIQKARPELLKIIEILTEKHYSDMVDLMVPLGEILVHCLDTSMLKSHSLNEVFPPITKFYMVCYCSHTRRIAFGSRNGTVVMHELRAGKTQTIHAHSRGVTACAFSEDGKHLATYSADEGKLNFWQASQSFLGMGQSQIKCVRQLPAPTAFPVTTPGGSTQIFKARLVWVGAKALTLLLPNGKETRFAM